MEGGGVVAAGVFLIKGCGRSLLVAGRGHVFLTSSTQCIFPTPVGAKGRSDTWQQQQVFIFDWNCLV